MTITGGVKEGRSVDSAPTSFFEQIFISESPLLPSLIPDSAVILSEAKDLPDGFKILFKYSYLISVLDPQMDSISFYWRLS